MMGAGTLWYSFLLVGSELRKMWEEEILRMEINFLACFFFFVICIGTLKNICFVVKTLTRSLFIPPIQTGNLPFDIYLKQDKTWNNATLASCQMAKTLVNSDIIDFMIVS